MRVEAILGTFAIAAKNDDENHLTKRAFDKYLNSDIWKYQKEARNILGGLTHFYRNDAGSEEGMGFSDELLLNSTITHYLEDCWTDNERVYGVLNIFDDVSLYAEDQKKDILQLLRLIKSGVQISLSIVCEGLWSDNGDLEEILSLRGVDFTLDPAFEFSRITKILD